MMNSDGYLQHYGIVGMKWGVRRYQNRDGSLTPEGKARYFNSDGSLTSEGRAEFYDKRGNLTRSAKKYEKSQSRNDHDKWHDAYKSASDKFNVEIQKINDKHKGASISKTAEGRAYVKEVADYWESTFASELKTRFGPSIQTGYEYVRNMPMMTMYSDILKELDD